MENRGKNISKKCYSLPALQRENEKLKQQLNVLQAAHDEKEILLSESLRKVELLENENHQLKEKVEVNDASTNVTIETVDVSTSIEISDVSVSIINTSDASSIDTSDASSINTSDASSINTWNTSPIEAQNELASSSDVDVNSEIQGKKKAVCKTSLFNETVRNLPYDEETKIIILDKNMKDPKFSSNMENRFKKIGGSNTSKVVNNILNAIATKNLQKKFVWDGAADNSFQKLKNILACIYSVVCSEEITHHKVNNIIKNTLKNARSQ